MTSHGSHVHLVSRDEVLALLEDGPKDAGQLVEWLGEHPQPRVNAALRALAREGLVKRVGIERRWALASYEVPTARPHLASGRYRRRVDEALAADPAPPDSAFEEDALEHALRPPLRQAPVVPAADRPLPWWMTAPRERFTEQASAHRFRMQNSREARWVDGAARQ